MITATSILLSLNSTLAWLPCTPFPHIVMSSPSPSISEGLKQTQSKGELQKLDHGDSKNWVPTIPTYIYIYYITLCTIIVCIMYMYVLCMIYTIK